MAAAVLLAGDEHDGKTYDDTGPESITLAQTAEILGRVIKRDVTYHALTPRCGRSSPADPRLGAGLRRSGDACEQIRLRQHRGLAGDDELEELTGELFQDVIGQGELRPVF